MKLFLDDIRNPPDDTWVVVRTAQEAIRALATGTVTVISFDHDLGWEEVMSGNDVARWIERMVAHGTIKLPKWSVHSMNPVGAQNIRATMQAAERIANR